MDGKKALISYLTFTLLTFASVSYAIEPSNLKIRISKKSGKAVSITNLGASRGEPTSSTNKSFTTSSFSVVQGNKPRTVPAQYVAGAFPVSDIFLKNVAYAFGVKGTESTLLEEGSNTDRKGNIHVRYNQYYRGIKVYGSKLIAHLKNGEVTGVNGNALSDIGIDTKFVISRSRAVKIARTFAQKAQSGRTYPGYLRQARKVCGKLRDKKSCVEKELGKLNQKFVFLTKETPKPYIYNKSFLENNGNSPSHLVWEVKLKALNGQVNRTYLVNAKNGAVVFSDSGERHLTRAVYDCTKVNAFSVCRIDEPRFINGDDYYLGRSEAAALTPRGPNPYPAPYNGSLDVDNAFDNYIPLIHQYLQDKLGRNGPNDKGGTGDGVSVPFEESRMYVHANGSSQGPTACTPGNAWNGLTATVFCAGSLSASAYDLLGHESAHYLTNYMNFNPDNSFNSLYYNGQAGALNEGFADVMGEIFEFDMTGSNDWQMFAGSNLAPPTPSRSLSNPPSIADQFITGSPRYPDRFNSPNVYCGAQDSGGIHHNATIPGKAAYLASMGGTFNGCTIQGIGREKVQQIWYQALANHFVPSETFLGAYNALIQACGELYLPTDCDELTKALQAVEMDQPGACSGIAPLTPTCDPAGQCELTSSYASI